MKVYEVLNGNNEKKLKFAEDYIKALNAATASAVDANANVTTKNISTLAVEISKKDIISLGYFIMYHYIEKQCGKELADQFLKDEDDHIIYVHDSTSLMPYCVAISLYPFLLDGLRTLGSPSGAPQNPDSYIGELINLLYMISAQFAGAVAVPEFLPYFDYFLRREYGDDYLDHLDEQLEVIGKRKSTLRRRIENWFQQFVHSINQPAGARGYQSPFTNIAYFDRGYFESIFNDFIFPDGDIPRFESTSKLQKLFMKWFNKERTKAELTFPVETCNLLTTKEDEINIILEDNSTLRLKLDEVIKVKNLKTNCIEEITAKELLNDFSNYDLLGD